MKRLMMCAVLVLLWSIQAMGQAKVSQNGISGLKYESISYKTGDTLSAYERSRCKLDIYMPEKSSGSHPVVIYFHGGGLSGGDNTEGWTDWSNYFGYRFLEAGVGVVAVNYRLSGQQGAKWPDYLFDAAAAVKWVTANINKYGGDPKSVFVLGFSAGAYITHMLYVDPRWTAGAGIRKGDLKGFIAISGQTRQHGTLAKDLGVTQPELMAQRPYAMPLALAKKGNAPLFLATGSKEGPTVMDNQAYYDALLKSGAQDASFYVQPDKDHIGIRDGLGDRESVLRDKILEFIRKN